MSTNYPMLSSDGHLEVLPERWTGRMPSKYKGIAPTTTTLPDGSDAIVMGNAGPFKLNYVDLRGGRRGKTLRARPSAAPSVRPSSCTPAG